MQDADFTPSAVSIVYIIVEIDATGSLLVSPDPAAAYVNQKVEWIALDPDVSIEIDWKNRTDIERPCKGAARRCGGRPIAVPANTTRLAYGVTAYRKGEKIAEIDPILEILR